MRCLWSIPGEVRNMVSTHFQGVVQGVGQAGRNLAPYIRVVCQLLSIYLDGQGKYFMYIIGQPLNMSQRAGSAGGWCW